MKFKTQDKQLLLNIKKAIIEGSNDPFIAWKHVFNQLYLDDMIMYIQSISTTSVIPGTGCYSPDIVIVTETAFNDTIGNVKRNLREHGTLPDTIWITSLIKSGQLDVDSSMQYLVMEINQLQPKLVITIGLQVAMSTNLQNILHTKSLHFSINDINKLAESVTEFRNQLASNNKT